MNGLNVINNTTIRIRMFGLLLIMMIGLAILALFAARYYGRIAAANTVMLQVQDALIHVEAAGKEEKFFVLNKDENNAEAVKTHLGKALAIVRDLDQMVADDDLKRVIANLKKNLDLFINDFNTQVTQIHDIEQKQERLKKSQSDLDATLGGLFKDLDGLQMTLVMDTGTGLPPQEQTLMRNALDTLVYVNDLVARFQKFVAAPGDEAAEKALLAGVAKGRFRQALNSFVASAGLVKEFDPARAKRDAQGIVDIVKDMEAGLPVMVPEYKKIQTMSQSLNQVGAVILEQGYQLVASSGDMRSRAVAQAVRSLVLVLVLAVIFVVILAIVIIRSITRPLQSLTGAARDLQTGNLQIVIPYQSTNELGQLAEAFRSMVSGQQEKASIIQAYAQGDFSRRIQPASAKDVVGLAIQTMGTAVQSVVEQTQRLIQAASDGRLDERADASRHEGEYALIIKGLNGMLDAVVTPLKLASDVVRCMGDGDLSRTITADFAGDFNQLKQSVNTCVDSLRRLQQGLARTIEGQKAGDLDAVCSAEGLRGAYAQLATGLNEALNAIVQPLREGFGILGEYAQGKLDRVMRELPGKQVMLTQGLQGVHANLRALLDDTNTLVAAALQGQLDARADAAKHQGDFRKVVEGINDMLDAVMTPLSEVGQALQAAAQQNLTATVSGSYEGQFNLLAGNVNQTIGSLNEALCEVKRVTQEVASGADQIDAAAQSLSQGATEQASSLEEISSSMQEIASQTKTNAENATQANTLTSQARDAAEAGSKQMNDMVAAMNAINESSRHIAKIIKVIDDIAFQTNLLALNAAVEAARAGQHGKGFAVVADEVRNLAGRSAKAAKETSDLIESSAGKVKHGLSVAEATSASFGKITGAIVKATDLVGEIAVASNEQAKGVMQINQGLSQVDQVTQQNTASAEETASAVTELISHTSRLNEMLARFTLRQDVESERLEGDLKALPPPDEEI